MRYESMKVHAYAGGDDFERIRSFVVRAEQLVFECEALTHACKFDEQTLKTCQVACTAAQHALLADAAGLLLGSERTLRPHSLHGMFTKLPNLSERLAALGDARA